jgi:hypothetical protein
MAYVGAPFAHDLFVSYSHGSDAQGQGLLRPWSVAFARELENELRTDRSLRNDLRLFMDVKPRPGEGVDPMSGLTQQLEQEIGASALLVVLMSPDYLASDWCRLERETWIRRQEELALPAQGRVAVVRIWPTQDEPWPTALCDGQGVPLLGFEFHDSALGTSRPLGWTDLKDGFGSDFRKAMLGLVGRLTHQLGSLRQRLAEQQLAQADAQRLQGPAGGQCIYLHGRESQRHAWEDAATALIGHGFAVVPGDPDPSVTDPQALLELRQQRVAALTDCDALLLLGTPDGRALDADLLAVGRHDRHSARARSQRLLPCGVLDTVGEPIATPVRKATARNLQTDWLDGTHGPWPPRVQQWLAAQGAAEQARR